MVLAVVDERGAGVGQPPLQAPQGLLGACPVCLILPVSLVQEVRPASDLEMIIQGLEPPATEICVFNLINSKQIFCFLSKTEISLY